ncbi:MAG: hypothetical protein ABL895_00185 [Cyclobacteriaceae bacterium]
MYRVLLLCFLIGLPLTGSTQHNGLLPDLLSSHPATDPVAITHRMNVFISTLREKRARNSDKEFVRLIFRESYRKFFDTYKPYAQVSEIFESGTYDCLSATSLLSVMLEEFNFDYKIIETNYHIFLSVETDTGPILLESTDRYNGIVSDPKQIEQRISTYRNNKLFINPSQSDKDHYQYNLNLYQIVQPNQLPGLLYFNQAVIAYNNKDLVKCAAKLDQARKIYESQRTSEFAIILVKSVVDSNLNEEEKKDLIRPFVKYLRNSNSVIASR